MELLDRLELVDGRKLVRNPLRLNWGESTLKEWLKLIYIEASDGKNYIVEKLD